MALQNFSARLVDLLSLYFVYVQGEEDGDGRCFKCRARSMGTASRQSSCKLAHGDMTEKIHTCCGFFNEAGEEKTCLTETCSFPS